MNKLIIFFCVTLIQLSTLIGVEIDYDDNFVVMKKDNELVSLVLKKCFGNNELNGARNISKATLFNSALNNSNSQAMKQLLIFAEDNGFRLFEHGAEGTEQLFEIINKCDKETASLAVIHAPDLVLGLNRYSFMKDDSYLLHLLMDHGLEVNCSMIIHLENATGETLERIIKKEGKDEFFASEVFTDVFFPKVLSEGRMDFLKVLETNGFSLATLDRNIYDVDDIICEAALSGENGNDEMLNYVLDALNAHGNSLALSCASRIKDGILFNNLLKKGYTIDPNSNAGLIGLFFAVIKSGNIDTIEYFLKSGVIPNDVILEAVIIASSSIEILELFISYGAKIGGLQICDAAEIGSMKLIKYFQEKGYNITHPAVFVAACGSTNLELIDFFLENGANIKDPNLLVSAARKGGFEILKHLIEKEANPNNLMALNTALRIGNREIAEYLIEKGAKLEYRSLISAGLGGDAEILRWVFEKTLTNIPDELERILVSPNTSSGSIIKYTLEHLIHKDSILVGIANDGHHFTDGIGGIAAKLMEQNENLFVVPLSKEIAEDDELMKKFSGFINPGAGDSYPREKLSFSLDDMDKERMMDFEHLYQRVISCARQYDIPYLGICSGTQHLILNNGGYLQPVKDHGVSITIHFEKGSIPHFMALLPSEKVKALQLCQLEDVSIENAVVGHDFAGVKEKLGRNVKLGAFSGKDSRVPESVYYGHNQIGVQFHPERGYFNDANGGVNRQRMLLDNFFDMTLNYQKSRAYGLDYGFSYEQVRDAIRQGNEKLINRLELCAKEGEQIVGDQFWGQNLGSAVIEADSGASVNMLTGMTAKDLGLARDGDDLVLVIKSTGETLSIKSHFAADGEHRVKSIDFADGSRLMLVGIDERISHIPEEGRSVNLETQPNFYRNASKIFTQ